MCSHTSFHDTSPAGFLSSLYLGNDFGYFKHEFSLKFVNTTTTTRLSSVSSSFIILGDVGDDAGEIIIIESSSFGRPTTDGDGSKDDRTPREERRDATLSRFVFFFREEKGESVLEEAQEEDIFSSPVRHTFDACMYIYNGVV
jgi:hypothetical protein